MIRYTSFLMLLTAVGFFIIIASQYLIDINTRIQHLKSQNKSNGSIQSISSNSDIGILEDYNANILNNKLNNSDIFSYEENENSFPSFDLSNTSKNPINYFENQTNQNLTTSISDNDNNTNRNVTNKNFFNGIESTTDSKIRRSKYDKKQSNATALKYKDAFNNVNNNDDQSESNYDEFESSTTNVEFNMTNSEVSTSTKIIPTTEFGNKNKQFNDTILEHTLVTDENNFKIQKPILRSNTKENNFFTTVKAVTIKEFITKENDQSEPETIDLSGSNNLSQIDLSTEFFTAKKIISSTENTFSIEDNNNVNMTMNSKYPEDNFNITKIEESTVGSYENISDINSVFLEEKIDLEEKLTTLETTTDDQITSTDNSKLGENDDSPKSNSQNDDLIYDENFKINSSRNDTSNLNFTLSKPNNVFDLEVDKLNQTITETENISSNISLSKFEADLNVTENTSFKALENFTEDYEADLENQNKEQLYFYILNENIENYTKETCVETEKNEIFYDKNEFLVRKKTVENPYFDLDMKDFYFAIDVKKDYFKINNEWIYVLYEDFIKLKLKNATYICLINDLFYNYVENNQKDVNFSLRQCFVVKKSVEKEIKNFVKIKRKIETEIDKNLEKNLNIINMELKEKLFDSNTKNNFKNILETFKNKIFHKAEQMIEVVNQDYFVKEVKLSLKEIVDQSFSITICDENIKYRYYTINAVTDLSDDKFGQIKIENEKNLKTKGIFLDDSKTIIDAKKAIFYNSHFMLIVDNVNYRIVTTKNNWNSIFYGIREYFQKSLINNIFGDDLTYDFYMKKAFQSLIDILFPKLRNYYTFLNEIQI
ncbi:hypothetical protein GVAV_002030 [Gurleya vavrai]